jgi:hypothetical protein
MGASAIAVELGGLGMQQQCERIVRGVSLGDARMALGDGTIALADSEQALRDGVTSAGLALVAAVAAIARRRTPDTEDEPHQQHAGDDHQAKHQHEHQKVEKTVFVCEEFFDTHECSPPAVWIFSYYTSVKRKMQVVSGSKFAYMRKKRHRME